MQTEPQRERDPIYFSQLTERPPNAIAQIKGLEQDSPISGWVRFYQTAYGVLLTAEIWGLPPLSGTCRGGFYGFHIHKDAHYNPYSCEHPKHAGDLPPLLSTKDGYAYLSVLSDRFTVKEIIGLTAVIHMNPDDFATQPSGNAGSQLAMGRIVPGKTIR